jgi:cytochrome oxidase Cu insertion factor (SCO1/SenC/PrrC family)
MYTYLYEPGLYQLRFTNGSIHLFLRGGKVHVNTDISHLSQYTVTGSPESSHLQEMYILLEKFNSQIEAIQDRIDKLAKDKTRNRELVRLIDSQDIYYSRIAVAKSRELKKFIEKIDTSAVSLLAAFYLDPYENYTYIKGVLNKFAKIMPYMAYYKQLEDKMKKITPTNIGDYAPDITADNIFGKPVSLNSLRGKNVLIYFWFSTEQKCRDENKNLKAVYDKYKSKGFEIYAVSFDDDKKAWQTAVTEDQANWVNVSNLVGWNDELAQNIYRVNKAPFMLLVDRKGKIVAKNINSSQLPTLLQKLP